MRGGLSPLFSHVQLLGGAVAVTMAWPSTGAGGGTSPPWGHGVSALGPPGCTSGCWRSVWTLGGGAARCHLTESQNH